VHIYEKSSDKRALCGSRDTGLVIPSPLRRRTSVIRPGALREADCPMCVDLLRELVNARRFVWLRGTKPKPIVDDAVAARRRERRRVVARLLEVDPVEAIDRLRRRGVFIKADTNGSGWQVWVGEHGPCGRGTLRFALMRALREWAAE
jgi:hypothetical protein